MRFCGLFTLVFLVFASAFAVSAVNAQDEPSPQLQAAIDAWLADDDAAALPALSALAAAGDSRAALLLGEIERRSAPERETDWLRNSVIAGVIIGGALLFNIAFAQLDTHLHKKKASPVTVTLAPLLSAIPRLVEGESVTTVALDLGYRSPSAFIAMFRRNTGNTPTRYIRRESSPE